MSTVGLTKAQERALRNLDGNRRMMEHLFDVGLIAWNNTGGGQDGWYHTPRGYAALAAPRMTQAEFQLLEMMEHDGAALWMMNKRAWRSCRDKCWIVSHGTWWELTPASRTALNNVRAAMGSPDWKEEL